MGLGPAAKLCLALKALCFLFFPSQVQHGDAFDAPQHGRGLVDFHRPPGGGRGGHDLVGQHGPQGRDRRRHGGRRERRRAALQPHDQRPPGTGPPERRRRPHRGGEPEDPARRPQRPHRRAAGPGPRQERGPDPQHRRVPAGRDGRPQPARRAGPLRRQPLPARAADAGRAGHVLAGSGGRFHARHAAGQDPQLLGQPGRAQPAGTGRGRGPLQPAGEGPGAGVEPGGPARQAPGQRRRRARLLQREQEEMGPARTGQAAPDTHQERPGHRRDRGQGQGRGAAGQAEGRRRLQGPGLHRKRG